MAVGAEDEVAEVVVGVVVGGAVDESYQEEEVVLIVHDICNAIFLQYQEANFKKKKNV